MDDWDSNSHLNGIVWIWVYSSLEKIWQEKPLTENKAMDFLEGKEENLDEWIRKLDYGTMHTASFWNIIIQWTSHYSLTEKFLSLVSVAKLVKWQIFKTALCDLTEKLLPSNFVRTTIWHKSSNQSGGQIHGSWKKNPLYQFLLYFWQVKSLWMSWIN